MKFSPNLKEFLEKDPEKTLLSFAWSCWWRLLVAIYGIILAVYFVVAILTIAFE